jgi:hypothetical protein
MNLFIVAVRPHDVVLCKTDHNKHMCAVGGCWDANFLRELDKCNTKLDQREGRYTIYFDEVVGERLSAIWLLMPG